MKSLLAAMLCITGLPTLLLPAAHAQDTRGTRAQREACTPDAFRLCGSAIPDPEKVEECLRGNLIRLSPGCRSAFDPRTRGRG